MSSLVKIGISGFKCWKEVSIDVKPLTLLIGPNGAGKSSILQALVILKRFVTTPNTLSVDNLGDLTQADYINMGRYEELVHRHDERSEIAVQLEVEHLGYSATYYVTFRRGPCSAGIKFSDGDVRVDLTTSFNMPYPLNSTVSQKVKASDGNEYTLIWNGVSMSIQKTPDQVTEPPRELQDSLNAHAELVKGIYLIHPRQFFRTFAYSYSPSVDYSKLHMTDQELANILAIDSDVEEKVATWIERIFDTEIVAKAVPPGSTIRLESRLERLRVPLSLEGAGLNRLAYVLANLVIPHTTVLLLEEPEAHLNPRILSKFGRLLPKMLREEQKQAVVTTHNEHLLLSLLTGIADGSLSAEDIAIYYLERDGLAAKARRLQITEKGQVEGGLPGFFEVDWETTEAYMKALAKGKG